MILENVFFTEIELENGSEKEFIEKGWYALNIHTKYPNEEISADAFLDCTRDLSWIEEKHIVILVKGSIDEETRETIEFLNEECEEEWKTSKKEDYKKKVDFIIVG